MNKMDTAGVQLKKITIVKAPNSKRKSPLYVKYPVSIKINSLLRKVGSGNYTRQEFFLNYLGIVI